MSDARIVSPLVYDSGRQLCAMNPVITSRTITGPGLKARPPRKCPPSSTRSSNQTRNPPRITCNPCCSGFCWAARRRSCLRRVGSENDGG